MFKCDKCNGTSPTSTLCENPCCPLMPCCGEKEEDCVCEFSGEVQYISDLKVALSNASHFKDTFIMLLGKEIPIKKIKFVLKHLN